MKMPTETGLKWDEALTTWESMLEHRRKRPTVPSEEMYMELMVKHYRQVKEAKEKGDPIVGMYEFNFPEIYYAMDLVPESLLIWGAGAIGQGLKITRESLDAAREVGFSVDTCSGWRNCLGAMLKGWLIKPDVIVSTVGTCDFTAFVSVPCAKIYDVPVFAVENLFSSSERSVQFMARELEDLIKWLEEHTGKHMDWDKLKESVKTSHRMVELNREIRRLQATVPSPFRPRANSQGYWAHWLYSGTPDGLRYLETLTGEIRYNAEHGIGVVPNERFRLYTLPPIPLIRLKVFEWLQRERNTVVVSNVTWPWDEFEMDPEKPLEALSRKYLNTPIIKAWINRDDEGGFVGSIVDIVRELKVDGVILWGNPACRPTAAFFRPAKDRLMKELGVPLALIDHDPTDADYTTEELLMKKLDEFLELLESRR